MDCSGLNLQVNLPSDIYSSWKKSVKKNVRAAHDLGHKPVILCSSALVRCLVRSTLERILPEAAVLSVYEIGQEFFLESLGVIKLDEGAVNNENK